MFCWSKFTPWIFPLVLPVVFLLSTRLKRWITSWTGLDGGLKNSHQKITRCHWENSYITVENPCHETPELLKNWQRIMEEQIPNFYDQKKNILFQIRSFSVLTQQQIWFLFQVHITYCPFRGLKATYHLFPATNFLLGPAGSAVLRGFQIHPVTGHLSETGRCVMITPQFLRVVFYKNHTQNTSKNPIQIYQCLS